MRVGTLSIARMYLRVNRQSAVDQKGGEEWENDEK